MILHMIIQLIIQCLEKVFQNEIDTKFIYGIRGVHQLN